MVPSLRARFNDAFTPDRYAAFLARLAGRCGMEVPFRNCETPCFFERATLERMADAGGSMVSQLLNDASYLAAADGQIPGEYRVPHVDDAPLFVQADFGIDASGAPKLVEIQGFPSLYAYQPALAETYAQAYDFGALFPDARLDPFLGGWDRDSYNAALRAAIVGDEDPATVVLLELHPDAQKTRPDFLLTEEICGIRTVDAATVQKRGRRLFQSDGTPIARIYNRVIVDEIVRSGTVLPFDFRDELDVSWAGHPSWYFRISKFSIPFLSHESVPESHFLSDVTTLPDDLENWVLKPLFSFAGLGVKVGPTRADIDAARPESSRWLLQRRVEFVPTIDTPEGETKVEVRIMLLNIDGDLKPMTALLRMGRGKMLGVDHNRDARWIGASAAFIVDAAAS